MPYSKKLGAEEVLRRSREANARFRSRNPEWVRRYRKEWRRRNLLDGTGKIYFIQAKSGPIKIGYTTKKPSGRLKELLAGSYEELTVLGAFPGTKELEAHIHERFRHLQIVREWFRPDDELLEMLRISTQPPAHYRYGITLAPCQGLWHSVLTIRP